MSRFHELKAGSRVSIPCRVCGKQWIPFVVQVGLHPVRCPACGRTTDVIVRRVDRFLRIWTRERG